MDNLGVYIFLLFVALGIRAIMQGNPQNRQVRSTVATPPKPFQVYNLLYLLPIAVFFVSVPLFFRGWNVVNAAPPADPPYTLFEPEDTNRIVVRPSLMERFPVGETVPVTYDMSAITEPMTEQAQLDQVRDWLLYAIVGDSASDANQLNRVLFDLPPVRYGYLEPTANFSYGLRRKAFLGEGDAVALLPAGDYQAHAILTADEIHKDTGSFPTTMRVYTYEIDLANEQATLTRQPNLIAADFIGEDSGYITATIATYDDLTAFMESTQRLTSVRMSQSGMVLTGRNLLDAPYLNINAEDVAALWQSQDTIDRELMAFYTEWYDDVDTLNRQSVLINCNLNVYILPGQTGRYSCSSLPNNNLFMPTSPAWVFVPTPLAPSGLDMFGTLAQGGMTQALYEERFAELQARMFEARNERGIVDASGFSLDPDFMYPELVNVLALVEPHLAPYLREPQMPQPAQINADLKANNIDSYFQLIDALRRYSPDCDTQSLWYFETDVLNVADGLAAGSDADLSQAIMDYKPLGCDSVVVAEALFGTAFDHYRFQHARYDGELEGTEVGMVLFYTDLLAKLWAINFDYSTPNDAISDFISLPLSRISPIYAAEQEARSSTRLWFGYQHEGFQTAGNQTMLFGDVSTRIYAASSDPLTPGRESEPNARSAAFLGWWDNHYATVAEYEPQYQRLNEIMKWSLVFAWMSNNEQLATADFLDDVSVDRSLWFPDWAAQTDTLRFQNWDAIAFHERGYRGWQIETLPMLSTPPNLDSFYWVGGSWEGGVSLAERYMFDSLSPLPASFADDLLTTTLRSNVDFSVPFNANQLSTLSGTRYDFLTAVGNAEIDITPPMGVRPRSSMTEMLNSPVQRSVTADISGVNVGMRLNDVEVGTFSVNRRPNGFEIGYESSSADRARQLGIELSQTGQTQWDDTLRRFADVRDAVQFEDGVAVRFEGDPRWFKLAPETPSIDLDPNAYMRVATLDADRGVQINLLDTTPTLQQAQLIFGSLDDLPVSTARTIPEFDHPLHILITNGNVDGLAVRIRDNPAAASELTEYYSLRLQQIDQLVEFGELKQAQDALYELRVIYGDTPELVLRDSLLYYDAGALQIAADVVNTSRLQTNRVRPAISDELTARIRAADNRTQQSGLHRLVQTTTTETADGQLSLYVMDDDTLNVAYTTNRLPDGEAVGLDDIPLDAVVYIADDYNLASSDPSMSVRNVLQQPTFGEDMRVIRLTDHEAEGVRPGRFLVEGESVAFERVALDQPRTTATTDIDADYVRQAQDVNTGSSGADCDPDEPRTLPQSCPVGDVYIITSLNTQTP